MKSYQKLSETIKPIKVMTRFPKPLNPSRYALQHKTSKSPYSLNPLRSIIIQIRLLRSRFLRLRLTAFAFSIMRSLEQLRALVWHWYFRLILKLNKHINISLEKCQNRIEKLYFSGLFFVVSLLKVMKK